MTKKAWHLLPKHKLYPSAQFLSKQCLHAGKISHGCTTGLLSGKFTCSMDEGAEHACFNLSIQA